MLIFPNAIRFIFQSGDQFLFQSFLSRDTCFSFILSLMTSKGLLEQTKQSYEISSTKAEKMAHALKGYYNSKINSSRQHKESSSHSAMAQDEAKIQLIMSPILRKGEISSYDSNFFPGCFNRKSWRAEIEDRLEMAKSQIKSYADFQYDLLTVQMHDVTLKHVVDSMYNHRPISYFDGSEN